MGVLSGIMCYESTPTTREFPRGVPAYVDVDTRLYALVPPIEIDGARYDHAITYYDRTTGGTACYLTAALWDFEHRGPKVAEIAPQASAAHRAAVKAAGGEVIRR